MDPTGSVESGSIPQTAASIVSSIITHINAWQRKLLEATSAPQANSCASSSSNPLSWSGPQGTEQHMGDAFSAASMGNQSSFSNGLSTSSINHASASSSSYPQNLSQEPFFPQFEQSQTPARNPFLADPSRPEATISDAEIDSILSGGMLVSRKHPSCFYPFSF